MHEPCISEQFVRKVLKQLIWGFHGFKWGVRVLEKLFLTHPVTKQTREEKNI